MKKTILVGIVAIALLFAFTACEPQALDYPIAGDNDIANVIVTEAPKFYAGSIETTGYGTITVERVGGKTTTGVTAMFSVLSDSNKVLPGKNPVAVAFGGVSGTAPNGTTWATTVDAIELESIVFESDYVEGTEISDAKEVGIKSVVGTYTDGTTISLLNNSSYSEGVSKSLDKENSAIVITAAAGVYSTEAVTASLKITLAPEEEVTPTVATVWTLQVADEDGVYADYAATTNKPSINWGETKADILSQIRIVAKTTTTVGEDITTTTEVLSEGSDYAIQGIASGELKNSGTFNVIPLVDIVAEKITFSITQYSYDVVDAINWEGMTVAWAETPENLRVGKALSTTTTSNPDIVVTLKKLSGEAVTSYSISYIGIYSYPETDYKEGDTVTPTVKITVGTGASAESATRTLPQKALGPKTN